MLDDQGRISQISVNYHGTRDSDEIIRFLNQNATAGWKHYLIDMDSDQWKQSACTLNVFYDDKEVELDISEASFDETMMRKDRVINVNTYAVCLNATDEPKRNGEPTGYFELKLRFRFRK